MTTRLLNWLAVFPSTNGRIVTSLALAVGTGLRVLLTDWVPPAEWLVFLTAWAGLDLGQYATKRATYRPDPPHETTPDAEGSPNA